jgi:hypothetical protein
MPPGNSCKPNYITRSITHATYFPRPWWHSTYVVYNFFQYIHFIHSSMSLEHFTGPGLFFSFVNSFTQTVWLPGRVISPSQGRYLHALQHKHRINLFTDIHALRGIETHYPSIRASEDSSWIRSCGNFDRQVFWVLSFFTEKIVSSIVFSPFINSEQNEDVSWNFLRTPLHLEVTPTLYIYYQQ